MSRVPLSFHFRNLGPAKEADVELGDLTIIAGRNNTGKTYLAYTLYGFLRMWKAWLGTGTFSHLNDTTVGQRNLVDAPDLPRISAQLRRDGRASLRMDKNTLRQQRDSLLRALSRDFSKDGIAHVFSAHGDHFENASIDVTCGEDDADTNDLSPIDFSLDREHYLSIDYDASQLVLAIGKTLSGASLTASPSLPYDLDKQVSRCYPLFLLLRVLPRPFVLSAERFGISLFYRELDFTKNQLVDLLQKLGDDRNRQGLSPFLVVDKVTSRYSLPIKDNIDYTRDIPNRRASEGELWTELSGKIRKMTDGDYRLVGDEIRFRSRSQRKGRSFNIPLHLASSSVRGLSDLYFFLRYEAKRTDLLIIDEPESHLDTRNQIELARLLARCVGAGLRVLITTHSDYLLKEINNLVMLAQDFKSKDAVLKKLHYTADDALDPSSIRAYVAENGGLTECVIDGFGIDMPVFDKTIDSINRVSVELASHVKREPES